MKWITSLFRFYINSSIHVTLAICALAGITFITTDIPLNFWFFTFLFSASITGYNFVKYAGYAKFHHRSLTKQLRSIQIFSLFSFIFLIVATLKQSLHFIIDAGLLGIFTLLYALPFLPNHTTLRRLKIIKIVVIAVVWGVATAGLPVIDKTDFSFTTGLRIFNYGLFVLAIIIPFEIRDLTFDDPDLGTLPQLVGIQKAKNLGYLLLLLFMGTGFLLPLSGYELTANIGIALLAGFCIKSSTINQPPYFASFGVESLPIVWLLLRLLAKSIA